MLSLTSKNYYKVELMHISWIRNLFHDLMTNNTYFLTFRQKWRNFTNSYLELWMLEFDNEGTITKLVTAGFVFHLFIHHNNGRRW